MSTVREYPRVEIKTEEIEKCGKYVYLACGFGNYYGVHFFEAGAPDDESAVVSFEAVGVLVSVEVLRIVFSAPCQRLL